jgi:hypothetical protein
MSCVSGLASAVDRDAAAKVRCARSIACRYNITLFFAASEGAKRHVNMTISLAFLAPSLIIAAVEGRLSHGIGVARLFDAPVAWPWTFMRRKADGETDRQR